ncbi:MAG: hypothetical protein AB7U47_11190 [Variibacter sp.]
MWTIFDGVSVPGLAIGDGSITMPLWVMATFLAILALFVVMTFVRGGLIGLTVLITLIALAVGTNWVLAELQRMHGRQALEMRLEKLRTYALAPGSPLSCLDGNANDAIEAGCEQVLFSRPENVAAATAYAASRISLLADGLKFAARQDPDFEPRLDQLRSSLERDRFGIASHVLMANNGCSADQCDRLTLLRDPTRMRNNMRDNAFGSLLARHALAWVAPAQNAARAEAPSGMSGVADVAENPTSGEAPVQTVAPEPAPAAGPAPMPQRRPLRRANMHPRPPAPPAPVALNPARP